MGKPNKSVNTKVEAALEKKAQVQKQKDSRAQAELAKQEEAEWSKGANLRGASRQEQEAAKAAEAARKAAEKKSLLEEEERALAGLNKTGGKKGGKAKGSVPPWEAALQGNDGKKTKWQRNMEAEAKRKQADEEAKKAGHVVVEEMELTENTNRQIGEQWTKGLDAALEDLAIGDGLGGGDKHPEKRVKAAYKAYEESMLPVVRAEKPGMKLSQYKDIIFKSWKSAPENPLNQMPKSIDKEPARPK
jgi:hypothetical protein